MDLRSFIHLVPNWPTPGVAFKDISPLLANPEAFACAIEAMHPPIESVDFWVGIESRGFLFAAALAQRFQGGLVMIRKKGKLPPPTVEISYALEYGNDIIQMHKGYGNVVIVDDVLATGGTLRAAHQLCIQAGYNVIGYSSLIDLAFLHGQDPFCIEGKPVHTVIRY
ncbi:MAG: adenine phosphoribosyltransferase [Gammaproteobacteria bacterium]|nr:adenine phosphoribosyltransferase [Gammaproteobacteria bacterium]